MASAYQDINTDLKIISSFKPAKEIYKREELNVELDVPEECWLLKLLIWIG